MYINIGWILALFPFFGTCLLKKGIYFLFIQGPESILKYMKQNEQHTCLLEVQEKNKTKILHLLKFKLVY